MNRFYGVADWANMDFAFVIEHLEMMGILEAEETIAMHNVMTASMGGMEKFAYRRWRREIEKRVASNRPDQPRRKPEDVARSIGVKVVKVKPRKDN